MTPTNVCDAVLSLVSIPVRNNWNY